MAVFDIASIRKSAKEDFTSTWLSTAALLPRNTTLKLPEKGRPHPVRELMQRFREVLLARGLDEAENLTILPDSDVTKQYGPEALVILDRAFYLAQLPRPEIGVSAQRVQQVEAIVGRAVDVEELGAILRSYKRGDIEADDLIEALMKRLNILDTQATEIIHRVFPELYNLKPVATDKTLRSHMTATWFHTMAALQDKSTHPIALFAVGPRYRNEQREDAHHLRVHHTASIAILDPEMSLEAGRALTTNVLTAFGFDDTKFEPKTATSKYYTPGLEEEAFAKYRGKRVEVADIGMYSPVALANFDIRYPVFNAGIGIERMAMILQGADDIRKLMFPQFSVVDFGDADIASALTYISAPKTDRGLKIAKAIEGSARKRGLQPVQREEGSVGPGVRGVRAQPVPVEPCGPGQVAGRLQAGALLELVAVGAGERESREEEQEGQARRCRPPRCPAQRVRPFPPGKWRRKARRSGAKAAPSTGCWQSPASESRSACRSG